MMQFNEQEPVEQLDDDESLKSKTQIKNELRDITRFGMDLAEIKLANLKKLPLNDDILDAYAELGRIKGNEARKRHFKRIGKLLREIDLEPIELALERFQRGLPLVELESDESKQFAEQWFLRLIDNDEDPEQFISEHPDCNRQQLRQLIRNAKKSKKQKSKLIDFIGQFQ